MGQRSRRGRGCVSVPDIKSIKETKKEMLECITCISDCDAYQLEPDGSQIVVQLKELNKVERPVIQKIIFGKLIQQGDLCEFLTEVDQSCHEIKKTIPKYNDGFYVIGYTYPTRFASSIIVSLAETTEGLLPIYTCVKPVLRFGDRIGTEYKYQGKWKKLSPEEEWNAFMDKIKTGGVRS